MFRIAVRPGPPGVIVWLDAWESIVSSTAVGGAEDVLR
jgi:hypothetical protein